MNSWKIILATVVIFGAGVVTGGLLVNYVNHSRPKNPHHSPVNAGARPPAGDHDQRSQELPKPRPPEILSKQFVQQLNDAIQLTPEQREKIGKILADGQERNHAIWTNNAAQMRAVMQDVRQKIHEELTPEQRKQFENLMKQQRLNRHLQNTNAPANSPSTNIPWANAAAN